MSNINIFIGSIQAIVSLPLFVQRSKIALCIILLQNIMLDILSNQGSHSTLFWLVLQYAQVEIHCLVEHLHKIFVIFLHIVGSVRVKAAFAHFLVNILATGLEQTKLIDCYSPNRV